VGEEGKEEEEKIYYRSAVLNEAGEGIVRGTAEVGLISICPLGRLEQTLDDWLEEGSQSVGLNVRILAHLLREVHNGLKKGGRINTLGGKKRREEEE